MHACWQQAWCRPHVQFITSAVLHVRVCVLRVMSYHELRGWQHHSTAQHSTARMRVRLRLPACLHAHMQIGAAAKARAAAQLLLTFRRDLYADATVSEGMQACTACSRNG